MSYRWWMMAFLMGLMDHMVTGLPQADWMSKNHVQRSTSKMHGNLIISSRFNENDEGNP